MEAITKLAQEYLSTQIVIIIVLVVIVIYLYYRSSPKSATSAPADKPSADNLLDQLEKVGAVKQAPDTEEAK
jgi:hypothetical protein